MNDDLSRLLDGELPAGEAEALRARIAADPALAARWARMQALPGRLAALPVAVAPPVPAIAEVRGTELRREVAVSTPLWRRAVPWLGWAVAAGALFATLTDRPTRVLVDGTELVSGRTELLAGDVRVAVDGVARVTVEPPAAGRREVAAEVPVDRSHLVAALAGSVVTVAVLQGSAELRAADAAPISIPAGETRTVGRPEAPRPVAARTPAPAKEDVASLRAELERAKLERAMAVGQLRRAEGQAQPWPAEVPAGFRADAFEKLLAERVAEVPDAEVAAVDCEEFPCIAVLRSSSTAPDWEKGLASVYQDLPPEMGDASVIALGTESATDAGTARLFAVGIAPGRIDLDGQKRMKVRATSMMEDLAAEITGQE